ncbi:hypothetical protein AGABI1DRAFT_127711 [Agaricus bisporus var. burnettii JB137-S8]|uniref:RING-type domain-containing protein n=1 Tax=Agaricus bisporus var. burnettii (strain JB137-S8 / ATCC MYA-4627 / FGSC 10392) TaxID=597362 RepID=K5XXK4_AGABU|nr:uncharacterized protein AGABI1DRAFT_127711 [Agaricus bisporus var. burnettii JB137-S8]EKM80035.1 hypothetical protein AGABI1DRAFT_127711 [Agaricus bisporus var. burnettii JB137-S8]
MSSRKRKQDELGDRCGDADHRELSVRPAAADADAPRQDPAADPCRESPGPPPLSPAAVDALFCCAVCHGPLRQPATLHCGHSVCAVHVTGPSDQPPPDSPLPPRCPLRSCDSTLVPSPAQPRIPASSRVRYHPVPDAAARPVLVQPETVPEPRLDVTLSKVLDLVARTKQALLEDATTDSSDGEPDSHSSAHDHSVRRPRKRRRRRISPPPEDDSADDLLSHLRKQAVHQRTLSHDEPVLPSLPPSQTDTPLPRSKDAVLARFQKDLLVELTCEICFVLLYQPITTPCQHTFCAKCLHRSLDHSPACPLCRQDLPGFAYFQDHPTNKTLLSIILKTWPMLYRERGEALAAEERDARLDTPIFVCQLSFPGAPTLLHFFEPRYRLMLRRCLESQNPRFGMIMAPKPGAGSPQTDYGTMLEIRSVQMLPDGRSMVETWGTFRFRIFERGTLDGIDDYPEDLDASSFLFPSNSIITSPETPSSSSSASTPSDPAHPPTPPSLPIPIHPNSPTNEELMTTCRTFLHRLQRGTAPWVVQRLSSTYGTMPTDPSAFSFWVALVLPIDEHEKAKLLPLRSARLRLLLLVHWIEQLNSQWYAFVWKVVACCMWTAFVLTISRLVGFI